MEVSYTLKCEYCKPELGGLGGVPIARHGTSLGEKRKSGSLVSQESGHLDLVSKEDYSSGPGCLGLPENTFPSMSPHVLTADRGFWEAGDR